jgi:hypothetical protein
MVWMEECTPSCSWTLDTPKTRKHRKRRKHREQHIAPIASSKVHDQGEEHTPSQAKNTPPNPHQASTPTCRRADTSHVTPHSPDQSALFSMSRTRGVAESPSCRAREMAWAGVILQKQYYLARASLRASSYELSARPADPLVYHSCLVLDALCKPTNHVSSGLDKTTRQVKPAVHHPQPPPLPSLCAPTGRHSSLVNTSLAHHCRMPRFALLLLAACALIPPSTAQMPCPCGLDIATNCTELLPDFTSNLTDVCSTTFGDSECAARVDTGMPRCRCPCGVFGEFCDTRVEAQTYNVSERSAPFFRAVCWCCEVRCCIDNNIHTPFQ